MATSTRKPRASKHPPFIVDKDNPTNTRSMIARFLEDMLVKNYSTETVKTRAKNLRFFVSWLNEREISSPVEVTRAHIDRYQRSIFYHRKKNGMPLSTGSQSLRLQVVRSFFKWMAKKNHILWNPASEVELPRIESRLPKYVMTVSEAEQVLEMPDVETQLGVRDRAILETLYSTGMRRMEILGLRIHDLDEERGTIFVQQGKGKKDRMVPIGDRALQWIERYLVEVRPQWVFEADQQKLFLTREGSPMSASRLTQIVGEYVAAADISKEGSCHLFRHTAATLMLENGADIRYIQALLGHARLNTTEIYTQVSIRRLKEVHSMTHPARLER